MSPKPVTEGTATLALAKGIFYNPRMAFNRTLSSLCLGAALPFLSGSRTLDGFCASGIRGIRYALENKVDEITFLDANPSAIRLAKQNAAANRIPNAFFSEDEFNRFAATARVFDVIDVDPFGTPAPFVQNAVRLAEKKAVLGLTATDLATLCGRKNQPARRRYDAQPLYARFGHEMALRIVLGFAARQAAMQDVGVKPLFCFYRDHFARVMVLLEKGAKKADQSLEKIGTVSFNAQTGHRHLGERQKGETRAGPLWVADTSDAAILNTMEKKAADEKTKTFLLTLHGEAGFPPWFFDVHHLVSGKSPKLDALIDVLEKSGFSAVRTHYCPTGIKTDASIADIRACL